MFGELLFVGLAVVVTLFAARQWPDLMRRIYRAYKRSRNLILGIIAVSTIAVFLGSGIGILILFGMLGVALLVLTLRFEKPHTQVKQWLP